MLLSFGGLAQTGYKVFYLRETVTVQGWRFHFTLTWSVTVYPQKWNVTVNVKGMGIHLLCRGVAKPPPLNQRTLTTV